MLKPDAKLCFECHEDIQKLIATSKFKHLPAENGECATCHSPHQSENPKLLSKAVGKLCLECHEEIEKQAVGAKSVHQPVANGECASCHNPHAGATAKLLAKAVPTLCYDCHELADLQKVERHRAAGDRTACLTCHAAHQSGQNKLLKGRDKTGTAAPKK